MRATGTYTNPVHDRDFPDPFVLRFNGRYYAYATGRAEDGRCFRMLSSTDLVHWTPHGGAVPPLDLPGVEEYWAPEVAYSEGRFHMYYAVGQSHDPDHHLRLAVAEHPLGPWQDAGLNLTPNEIFAIDAHPYRDPVDGQWYLFYARDDLTPPFAGTGVVVDRLLAMDRLEGKPREVVRPYAEWQVFELKRGVKRGLDWYTVEGPFVLRRGNRYVCLYSGGRWENPNYGVAYALADHPLGPWTDDANAIGPQVLRTDPGRVVGPGHNSVVIGPDLVTPWVVYHGWDVACTARYPRIDPLIWRDGRPACPGPSSGPQPLPPAADFCARFDEAEPGPEWEAWFGAWERTARGLRATGGPSFLALKEPQRDFVAELDLEPGTGSGIRLGDVEVTVEAAVLRAGAEHALLPGGFRHGAWHRLRLVREGSRLVATLDDYPTVETICSDGHLPLAVVAGAGSHLAHFSLTRR